MCKPKGYIVAAENRDSVGDYDNYDLFIIHEPIHNLISFDVSDAREITMTREQALAFAAVLTELAGRLPEDA